MKNNINTDLWLSRVGLGLIFCYCLMASIFYSYFAQIHLTLHFFPFPIFVGEVLLFICLVLLGWVCKDGKSFTRRTILLLGLYFGWVLVKALINYCYDGPLTCRNAALFYYPIFAVFAYCFYQKARIPRNVLMSLALLAAGIMFFKVMIIYYWWTYVTLFVIVVWNTKSVKWRRCGWIFLAVIFILGKEYFYQGSRAHFVSVFSAIVFLVSYFWALLAKRREYVRLIILFITVLFFTLGYFVFSEHNTVSSVTSLKEMVNTYNAFDRQYQAKQAAFVPEKLSVRLYNPKKFATPFLPSSRIIFQPAVPASAPAQPAVSASATSQQAVSGPVVPSSLQDAGRSPLPGWMENILNDILCSRIREGRSLDLDENNIVFRLFVWRDMARELVEKRAWGGFSFGHPQRSRSLEVLGWAQTEWARDGWITPHNSFFHIIYRAGILGVALIGILFFMVGRLIRDFFNMNSIEGGLLVGALIYWLVLSNFLVILEFPYDAIVFWSLFGITWAYRDGLKAKAVR